MSPRPRETPKIERSWVIALNTDVGSKCPETFREDLGLNT